MTAALQPQDGRIAGSPKIPNSEGAFDSIRSTNSDTTTTTSAADVPLNDSGIPIPHHTLEKIAAQETGLTLCSSQQPQGNLESQSIAHEGARNEILQVSQQDAFSTTTNQGTSNNTKGGRTSERDSINALLSLGRDLQGGELDGATIDPTATSPKRAPESIPPDVLPSKATKKRQRKNDAETPPHKPSVEPTQPSTTYQQPPDFWYWLSASETVGEWDVLCGRGGESNNFIGNRKYRKMVNERKPAYREIPVKNRKAKTAFVRAIVQHVNNCGGRFVDLDERSGKYYVVTMDKARKKTSQALRETKELKWLDLSETKERKAPMEKNTVCPHCDQPGHKTKIAKACLKHREWLDANAEKGSPDGTETPSLPSIKRDQITGSHSESSMSHACSGDVFAS